MRNILYTRVSAYNGAWASRKHRNGDNEGRFVAVARLSCVEAHATVGCCQLLRRFLLLLMRS